MRQFTLQDVLTGNEFDFIPQCKTNFRKILLIHACRKILHWLTIFTGQAAGDFLIYV
jgi:hypothetical protein